MGKSWKTTVVGFAFGFLNLYLGGVNAKTAAMSIGLATVSALAKDHNVTGA